jgi:hypothetical protein
LSRFGDDIVILEGAHNRRDSYSYLGDDYELPAGMVWGSKKAYSYLAGSQKFKVKQLEVFAVTLKW